MIELTKMILLWMLSKNYEITQEDLENVITRMIPSATTVVTNESPEELQEEIKMSIQQINYYAKKAKNLDKCIILNKNNQIKASDGCLNLIEELYKDMKQIYETEDTLIATYGKLIMPMLS